MPIQNPNGEATYWFEGARFSALQKATGAPDTAARTHWFEGQPIDFMLPAAGAGGQATSGAHIASTAQFFAPTIVQPLVVAVPHISSTVQLFAPGTSHVASIFSALMLAP